MTVSFKEQVKNSTSSLVEITTAGLIVVVAPALATKTIFEYYTSKPDYADEKAEAMKNNQQTQAETIAGGSGMLLFSACVATFAYLNTANRLRLFSDDVGHMVAGLLPTKKPSVSETAQPL